MVLSQLKVQEFTNANFERNVIKTWMCILRDIFFLLLFVISD